MNSWQTESTLSNNNLCKGMANDTWDVCGLQKSELLQFSLRTLLLPTALSTGFFPSSIRHPHRLPFLPRKIHANHGLREADLSLTMKRVISPSVLFHYTSHCSEIDCALNVCCWYWSSMQRSCACWVVSSNNNLVISRVYHILAVRIPFLKIHPGECLHTESFLPEMYTLSLTCNFRSVLLPFTGEVFRGLSEQTYWGKKAGVRR